MNIQAPFAIAPNLEMGLPIGSDWVTIRESEIPGSRGRVRFKWTFLIGSQEFSGYDLESPPESDLVEGMHALLDFLCAAAESLAYGYRTGKDGENVDLFPRPVVEWAYQNSSELQGYALEIEESKA